jgi:hypothetical protein
MRMEELKRWEEEDIEVTELKAVNSSGCQAGEKLK